MNPAVYVMDTGYLLELFDVPGCSVPNAVKEVRRRYEQAIENNCRIYVPVPCIFEVGNHIAGVSDGRTRTELAKRLRGAVVSSVDEGIPWNMTPAPGFDFLPDLCAVFEEEYSAQCIGLTDICTIEEAMRLKQKYSGLGYRVHIWTTDDKVKAREPDTEEHAFLRSS
ncbi:MAG: hypothetical protein ACFFCW_39840 [Candidatus Hodarchaeota archaeon]